MKGSSNEICTNPKDIPGIAVLCQKPRFSICYGWWQNFQKKVLGGRNVVDIYARFPLSIQHICEDFHIFLEKY